MSYGFDDNEVVDSITTLIDKDGFHKMGTAGSGSIDVDLSKKADKLNPVFTGNMSMYRKADTETGACSVVLNYNNTATGMYSFAEGTGTKALANCAHAEGAGTTASGINSHAEGSFTIASGRDAHAEGNDSEASGDYSHAEGKGTIAAGDYSHVFGQYNLSDDNDTYAEIVGNGSNSNARSNARTLSWNGDETLSGTFTCSTSITIGSTTVTEAQLQQLLALLN